MDKITIETSVKSLINQEENNLSEEQIQTFLQDYDTSSKLGELLDIVEKLENENSANINQLVSFGNNIEEDYRKTLNQINAIDNDLNQNYSNFQNNQTRFENFYQEISSNFIPFITRQKNLEGAIELYSKIKIGLNSMDLFLKSLFATKSQEMIKFEGSDGVILVNFDKMLQINDDPLIRSNKEAMDVYQFGLNQCIQKIAKFLDDTNNLDKYAPLFEKLDEEKYKNGNEIKIKILHEMRLSNLAFVQNYQPENIIKNSKKFVTSFIDAYTKVKMVRAPLSFHQSIDQIFSGICTNFIHSIDEQLKLNDKVSFSYSELYDYIQSELSRQKSNLHQENFETIKNIFKLFSNHCANEIIQKWKQNLEIKIANNFSVYVNDPKTLYTMTLQYIQKNPKPSGNFPNTIYYSYLGNYIIKEVLEIIKDFEYNYSLELSHLEELKNPKFTLLLIEISNQIIRNLNNIQINNNIPHRRSSIIIIINSYVALRTLVDTFKQKNNYISNENLIGLASLDSCTNGYISHFASRKHFDISKVDKFYKLANKIVSNFKKIEFTTLFTQNLIALIIQDAAIRDTINIKSYKAILNHNIELSNKLKEKIQSKDVQSVDDKSDLMNIKNLCEKTIEFLKTPQNSLMNDIIDLFKGYVIPDFNSNMIRIINKK